MQEDYQKVYNDYLNALKYDSECLSAIIGLADYYSNIVNNYGMAIKYYNKAKQLITTRNRK